MLIALTDLAKNLIEKFRLAKSDLACWRPYSVNGSTDLYYIRCHLESGDYVTTSPIENFIKTDILILQYLANVTTTDQTLVVVPEYLWPFLVIVPFVPGLLKKRKNRASRASFGDRF